MIKKIIATSLLLVFVSIHPSAQVNKPYSIIGTETYVSYLKINQREYNLADYITNKYNKSKKDPL
jgi:hypothetical protein